MDCDSGGSRVHACLTRPMWQELDRVIDDFLESRTLADLLTEDKKHEDYSDFRAKAHRIL